MPCEPAEPIGWISGGIVPGRLALRSVLKRLRFLGEGETGERDALVGLFHLYAPDVALPATNFPEHGVGAESIGIDFCDQPVVARLIQAPELTQEDRWDRHERTLLARRISFPGRGRPSSYRLRAQSQARSTEALSASCASRVARTRARFLWSGTQKKAAKRDATLVSPRQSNILEMGDEDCRPHSRGVPPVEQTDNSPLHLLIWCIMELDVAPGGMP